MTLSSEFILINILLRITGAILGFQRTVYPEKLLYSEWSHINNLLVHGDFISCWMLVADIFVFVLPTGRVMPVDQFLMLCAGVSILIISVI